MSNRWRCDYLLHAYFTFAISTTTRPHNQKTRTSWLSTSALTTNQEFLLASKLTVSRPLASSWRLTAEAYTVLKLMPSSKASVGTILGTMLNRNTFRMKLMTRVESSFKIWSRLMPLGRLSNALSVGTNNVENNVGLLRSSRRPVGAIHKPPRSGRDVLSCGTKYLDRL